MEFDTIATYLFYSIAFFSLLLEMFVILYSYSERQKSRYLYNITHHTDTEFVQRFTDNHTDTELADADMATSGCITGNLIWGVPKCNKTTTSPQESEQPVSAFKPYVSSLTENTTRHRVRRVHQESYPDSDHTNTSSGTSLSPPAKRNTESNKGSVSC